MKKIAIICLVGLLIAGCAENKPQWVFSHQITLPKNTRPLAVVKIKDKLWISDPPNYRLLKTDLSGNLLDSISNIKRPMNIGAAQNTLYIPEYLTDTIWKYTSSKLQHVPIQTKLRAPAGITVQNDSIAIADFYNHRIVLQVGDKVKTIGSKGHKNGQLYYPTDVKIYRNKMYVADAYNHRIQVFKNNGEWLKVIGADDTLKVASGIDITSNNIAITDQEHNRVMIYDHTGKVLQQLMNNIKYPSDVLLTDDTLYISNFKDNALTVYIKK